MTETLRLRQRTAALLLTAALALGAMGAAATAQPAFADDVVTDGTTTPATTAIDKVTAKWSKGKNDVSGYQIKYSKSKSMKGAKTVTAGKSATSKKISGLKANTKYYVQVRAYKTVDGKKYYSDWSAKKSVKTKAKAKKSSGGTVYITNTGEKYRSCAQCWCNGRFP